MPVEQPHRPRADCLERGDFAHLRARLAETFHGFGSVFPTDSFLAYGAQQRGNAFERRAPPDDGNRISVKRVEERLRPWLVEERRHERRAVPEHQRGSG